MKGFVVEAGANRFNENTEIGGMSPIDIKVSKADTNGIFSLSEYTGFAKGGPPLHIHPDVDEIFYILEGDLVFQLGDEQFHLTAGDTIFVPRNVPHAHAQISEKCRYLFFVTPSGKMEDFFRAIATINVNGQPSAEQMAKMFVDHNMTIAGPPLPIQ